MPIVEDQTTVVNISRYPLLSRFHPPFDGPCTGTGEIAFSVSTNQGPPTWSAAIMGEIAMQIRAGPMGGAQMILRVITNDNTRRWSVISQVPT